MLMFGECVDVVAVTRGKLQVKLADPEVVSNPGEYQRLAQSVSELDEVLLV